MQLRDPREHVGAVADLRVERGPLVRVLSVGEVEDLLVGEREVLGVVLVMGREPAADRGVVAGGLRERLVGQPVPGRLGDLPAGLLELGEHGVVGLRLDKHGHAAVVLGRGADHRRPADVDVLDRNVGIHLAVGDRLLERVEVDADQVDRLDPLALEGRDVLGVVAAGEQRRVQPRVQRLHPPAEDLGRARELGDIGDLDPGLAQRGGGAAGGEDLDPEPRRGPLAKSATPVLSETEISARRTRRLLPSESTAPASAAVARPPLPPPLQSLVGVTHRSRPVGGCARRS